jgi:hypothetical protein
MLFGRGVSFPFRQTTHAGHFVGWRYLVDSRHRKQLRQRWLKQPSLVTAVEVFAGVLSSLFLIVATAACTYLFWSYWV